MIPNQKIKQTYHNVIRGEYRFSTTVLANGQPPITLKERTSRSNFDLLNFGSAVNLTEIQQRSSLSILRFFLCFPRISPNLASNSPMAMHFANENSFSKAGHFPAAPFTANLANGQTLSPKTGQSRLISSYVTKPGY